MPAVVCLISLLSCVWLVGNPLVYSLLSRPLTNFSFVIILLKFPHSKAENAPWPYVARHNRALRLIFLAPVWASWLSRFPWLLPTQNSRLLLVADILVFVSSSVVAGISSYYATSKDGPEQLICFTVGGQTLFQVQANISSQALNSVYMVYDHFALLFWYYRIQKAKIQKAKQPDLESNSDSHHGASSGQATKDGILANQDSQTSQQPRSPRGPNIVSDSQEGPGGFCAEMK